MSEMKDERGNMSVLLRFSTTSSPISWLIRTRTMAPVSHVEFELDGGWTFGARMGGVEHRPPSENRGQWNVVRATYPKIELAYEWATRNRSHFGYDLLADIGIGFNEDWHARHERMCSELQIEAAEAVGAFLLNRRIKRFQVWPGALLLSPALQIVGGSNELLKEVKPNA